MTEPAIRCCRCRREPHEIPGLSAMAKAQGYESAERYVEREEGTFNSAKRLFACDACYVAMGQPAGRTRWTADRYYQPYETPGSGPAAPKGSPLRAFQDSALEKIQEDAAE